MGICVFDTKQIAECARHALASSEWSMGYEKELTPRPMLMFVHDQGVYCMSNGIPRQPNPTSDGSYVAYARGCDPNAGVEFDEWYGTSRDLVGGDDFVEVLSLDEKFLEECELCDEFCVEVKPETLCAYFLRRSK